MRIVGLDTTTKYLSIAALDDDRVLAYIHKEAGESHSSLLSVELDGVLRKAGLGVKDIEGIALSIGPGSFTGLRISVAFCKALVFAVGMKIIGVPTLDIIARNYTGGAEFIAPILDARKNKIYSCVYRLRSGVPARRSDYILTDINSFLAKVKKPCVVFGDGAVIYKQHIEKKYESIEVLDDMDWYPRAETAAKIGIELFKKGMSDRSEKLAPMYLHPSDCNVVRRK